MDTSFFRRHWRYFALSLFLFAVMLACPDAMAQSSSVPAVNRFARFVAGILPADVVIPIIAFAFVVCALFWAKGKMEGSTFIVILVAGILAGSASWWAQQAVSLGTG